MNIRLKSEKDFSDFKNTVSHRLSNRTTRIIDNPGLVESAVMMLFMNKNEEPHVLLTKRTDKVKTHKGEMSFPGGGSDDTDGDILETAYRETFEEVGIQKDKIELIGKFDDYFSIMGFHVTPFVGAVEYPAEYRFNQDEIDDYLEVPISIFIDKKYDRVQHVTYNNIEYKIYHYFYKSYEIWGLTARILTDFAEEVLSK